MRLKDNTTFSMSIVILLGLFAEVVSLKVADSISDHSSEGFGVLIELHLQLEVLIIKMEPLGSK